MDSRIKVGLVILFLAIVCNWAVREQPKLIPIKTNYNEYIILEETNQQRLRRGLPALMLSAELSDAAKLHTDNMVGANKLSHTLPIKGMKTLIERIKRVGYVGWKGIAENIAYNYAEEKVVDGWMNSSGHRQNILGDYTEIGIGITLDREGRPYYCQVFGRR